MRGWTETRRGDHEAGLTHILDGYASHVSLGMHGGLPVVLGFAAEALAAAGRLSEAEQRSAESLALASRLGERGMLPLLLVMRSKVATARGDTGEAAAHLDAALAEARTQQAPGAELVVWIARAERAQAGPGDLEGLAAAYARVVEGRDTPIAARARALLARGAASIPRDETQTETRPLRDDFEDGGP
jgi:hypothetical protein